MLDRLRRGPRTTGELGEAFPSLSRFAIMQHLGVLEEAGLVLVRRDGRHRYNFLNAVPLQHIYERWVSRYAGQLASQTLRVKGLVERRAAGKPGSGRGGAELAMDEFIRILKIENEVRIAATPEQVFEAITIHFGDWWPHRFRDGARLVLEPHIGGRCYEDWGNGAGALYAEVTHLDPPARLCLRGPWGLNGESQVIMWWYVEPSEGGAVLKRSFRAWGQFSEEMAERYREGAQAAIGHHLKSYVERMASRSSGNQ
jgi:DNA-binding transcriptional ArsR family regulator